MNSQTQAQYAKQVADLLLQIEALERRREAMWKAHNTGRVYDTLGTLISVLRDEYGQALDMFMKLEGDNGD